MKTRQGFVSNSSSSSFVIRKVALTRLQLVAIRHHDLVGTWFGMDYCDMMWAIEEDDWEIRGHTWMDNFSMCEFLGAIGVTDAEMDFEVSG